MGCNIKRDYSRTSRRRNGVLSTDHSVDHGEKFIRPLLRTSVDGAYGLASNFTGIEVPFSSSTQEHENDSTEQTFPSDDI